MKARRVDLQHEILRSRRGRLVRRPAARSAVSGVPRVEIERSDRGVEHAVGLPVRCVDRCVDRTGGIGPDVIRPLVQDGLDGLRRVVEVFHRDFLKPVSASALRLRLRYGAAAPAGAMIKLAMAKTIIRRLQPARMRICMAPSCVGKILKQTPYGVEISYTHPQRDAVMYRDRLGLSTGRTQKPSVRRVLRLLVETRECTCLRP